MFDVLQFLETLLAPTVLCFSLTYLHFFVSYFYHQCWKFITEKYSWHSWISTSWWNHLKKVFHSKPEHIMMKTNLNWTRNLLNFSVSWTRIRFLIILKYHNLYAILILTSTVYEQLNIDLWSIPFPFITSKLLINQVGPW